MRKNLYWHCTGRNWPCNWYPISGNPLRRQKIPSGVSVMFCPKCGTLSFPTPSGHMTCNNYKCGYSGDASNPIFVHGKEIDVSRVSTRMREDELTRGHREFGDPMSPFWDEPGVRLQSTQSRKCPNCGSSNLRIRSSEEECLDCGSHVP